MSAYFEAGFSVREPMWHGLGKVLEEYPGREQAEVDAGHDFVVVEKKIVMLGEPIGIDADLPDSYASLGSDYFEADAVGGWKSLVYQATREDDPLDGNLLHVARADWTVIQNSTGWDIAEAMISDEKTAKFETGITLKGGAICSILFWLDEPVTIPGDNSPILPFGNVSWAHDGSGSMRARATSIRTVCWNTQSAAEAQGKAYGTEYVFRHTKNVMERIEEAKLAMRGIRGEHEEFVEIARELAKIPVTKKQRSLFVSGLIPMPEEALISDRVKANVEEARSRVHELFEGETIPEEHRLTGWGLFNAGTEYLDHVRGWRNPETRYGRSILRPEPAKAKLGTLIREVVKA
jgi:phage/plasmid-like protein (TIGR03299 family)